MLTSNSFATQGAIISGDTVGVMYEENYFHVGMEEHAVRQLWLSPNPATDLVQISGVVANTNYHIVDIQGRLTLSGRLSEAHEVVDIKALLPGAYVIQVANYPPLRLLIAR